MAMDVSSLFQEKSRSEVAVSATYASITAYIAADQLFSSFLPSTLIRVFELLSLVAIFWFVLQVFLCRENARYRGWPILLIALLAISCLSIIARGEYEGGIKNMILVKFSYTQIPAYILPFAILVLPNRKYLTAILNVFFFSMLAVIPIWLMQSVNLIQQQEGFPSESIGAYLPFFGTVLILFRRHLSTRRRRVVYAIYFAYFMLMILNARRNMIVSLSLWFGIAYLMGNATKLKTNMRARLLLLSGVVAVAVFVAISWGWLSQTVFQFILDRGMEDTRSGVEALFLADMASSPVSDWVFGRGIDGTYIQMTEDAQTLEVSFDRYLIETGYLYAILKGGLFHLLLYLLFLFTAFIRGISVKKHLLQGLALFLAVYLLEMYMTNWVFFFSVKAVVFWFAVSVCLQYKK